MLKSIAYPSYRRYKSRSEWEPVGFFSECLCNATRFDLMLGFFSSSAFNVLADGFAAFIYNGGNMRLIINDILSEEDKDFISIGKSDVIIPCFNLENIEFLKETLSERSRHFFDCLAFLIRNKRLSIKIIRPKDNSGISHTKSGLFSDGVNSVSFDGSCNFSKTALLDNIESITAFCDWDGDVQKANTERFSEDFEFVFSGQDDSVEYLEAEDVTTRIAENFPEKSVRELLEDEQKIHENDSKSQSIPATILRALSKAKQRVEELIEKFHSKNDAVEEVSTEPRFPYKEGPRDYQKEAFENWKSNNQKGLFAMATGTGKTITSLNCLLEIYKRKGYYKALILVPTITLVEQWEKECRKFNFHNITKVCSKYPEWRSSISRIRTLELLNSKSNLSYIIISTYASFVRSGVFQELNNFSPKQTLLIADEAHNMNGGLMLSRLPDIKYSRRIGLSATPKRHSMDENAETANRKLYDFFGCSEKFTFEYSMQEAIKNKALCRYYYYPHIVTLTHQEMVDYIEVTKKIVKMMGRKDAESQEILTAMLLKRKRIIHKAENKKSVFEDILKRRLQENGNLKYSLVYVPEGNKPDTDEADILDKQEYFEDDEDAERLISEYTKIISDLDRHLIVKKFTSDSRDRENMLKGFASGEIDVLTSMKCLDEGVDVPRSEFAIFCASTGNPRQFIQRRGRVLRTCQGKERAIIHDLVVVPDDYEMDQDYYNLEKSLVRSELERVKDFALLSENLNYTEIELGPILEKYNLSIF